MYHLPTFDFFSNSVLVDHRKSESPQIWAVGCSITVGLGVLPDQSWKHIVQRHLNLPMSSLCQVGSSIIWQSDQIIQSDIRANDIVFWGLTGQHRLPVIVNNKVFHYTPGSYMFYPNEVKELDPRILSTPTLAWHNIMAVRRASNFCSKVGAKLIILGVLNDHDNVNVHYNVPNFEQVIKDDLIDYGSDQRHPGPLQHKKYAEIFLEKYYNA